VIATLSDIVNGKTKGGPNTLAIKYLQAIASVFGVAESVLESPDMEEFRRLLESTPRPLLESTPRPHAWHHLSDALHVGSLETVSNNGWGWSCKKLLDSLIELDYRLIDDLTEEHEGIAEQWTPVFRDHPETWRVIYDTQGHIVGYWHFAPLMHNEYELVLQGKLLESKITTDTVTVFELPGWYDIYFTMMGIEPRYKTKGFALLLTSLLDVFDILSQNNIYIRNICANAFTPSGEALCKTLNMTYLLKHVSGVGSIYKSTFSEIMPMIRKRVGGYDNLYQRYFRALESAEQA
jgi:hypothetical protein